MPFMKFNKYRIDEFKMGEYIKVMNEFEELYLKITDIRHNYKYPKISGIVMIESKYGLSLGDSITVAPSHVLEKSNDLNHFIM